MEEEVECGEEEEEDDPLLRGFLTPAAALARAPAPVRGSGRRRACLATRPRGGQPGLQRGRPRAEPRAAGRGDARSAGVRRPGSPPPTPAARRSPPPRAGVWSWSRRRGGGAWNLETDPAPPPPAPECTDSPSPLSFPSPPPCRREAPPSLPSRQGAARAGPGRSSGGGRRGSQACSEGPLRRGRAEARAPRCCRRRCRLPGRDGGGAGSLATPQHLLLALPAAAGRAGRQASGAAASGSPPQSSGKRRPRGADPGGSGGGGGAVPAPAAAAVFLFRIQEETCRNFCLVSGCGEKGGSQGGE